MSDRFDLSSVMGDQDAGEKREKRVYLSPKGIKLPKHFTCTVLNEGSLIARLAGAENIEGDVILEVSDKELTFLSTAQEFLDRFPVILMSAPEIQYSRVWYMYMSKFNSEDWSAFAHTHEPGRMERALEGPVQRGGRAKFQSKIPAYARSSENRKQDNDEPETTSFDGEA